MTDRERAIELAAEGLGPTEIGRRLGVAKQTIFSWTSPRSECCDGCGEERVLAASGCRSHLCLGCSKDARRNRWRDITRLWADGLTHAEMAERVGGTAASVGVTMAEMRRKGWDLPYRYPGNAQRFGGALGTRAKSGGYGER